MSRFVMKQDWLCWGNDYPHHDSIWPHSQEVLQEILRDVPEHEQRAMTAANAAQLYKISVPSPG